MIYDNNISYWMLFVLFVTIWLLCITGCSTKVEEKFIEVNIPVPSKCDFNISKSPEIKTETLQEILQSVTDLSYDSKILREQIKVIPCLNIIEK